MEPRHITPEHCRLSGWEAVAWCSACRSGRKLDLITFVLERDRPFSALIRQMRCKDCHALCGSITIHGQKVGKEYTVAEVRPMVDVVGKLRDDGR